MATIAGHTQDHDFRCAGHMRNGKRNLFQQFSETRGSTSIDDKSPARSSNLPEFASVLKPVGDRRSSELR